MVFATTATSLSSDQVALSRSGRFQVVSFEIQKHEVYRNRLTSKLRKWLSARSISSSSVNGLTGMGKTVTS